MKVDAEQASALLFFCLFLDIFVIRVDYFLYYEKRRNIPGPKPDRSFSLFFAVKGEVYGKKVQIGECLSA